jgi:hypothetical protein
MGEKGNITRLLAAKYGGYLTFAALSPERASAPGQPTISQLQQLYRFGSQGRDTKLFGIMGNPVSHSKSPLIHNSAFKQLGKYCVWGQITAGCFGLGMLLGMLGTAHVVVVARSRRVNGRSCIVPARGNLSMARTPHV